MPPAAPSVLTTVVYEELDRSGDMFVDKDGVKGTRLFEVAWSDRLTFVTDLLKYPVNYWPGIPALRCKSVQMTGKGEPGYDATLDMITYPFCDVTAEYSTLESDEQGNGTRRTDELDVGGQFISAGKGTFRWSSDNAVIEDAPGKYVGTIAYTIDIEEETSVPLSTIVAAAGKVNSSSFLGLAAGLALYEGAKVRRTSSRDGTRTFAISHKFQLRSVSWNQLLRPSTGAWADVTPVIYDSYNLNLLVP